MNRIPTRIPILTTLIALLALLASAAAQVVVNPQSIVVNPRPAFDVEVSLNKDPSGNGQPVYRIGETVTIDVTVDRTAFVYLFDVKPNGQITQILPNRLSGNQSNRVQAGRTITFPPQGAPYQFQIDGPTGLSKVIAVASAQELDTNQLAQFRSGEQLATSDIGQEGFADAFSIVVRPVPQNEWSTDTALYYVGQRPSAPAFSQLRVTSSPAGAEVTIDGRFAGYTPVDYPVRPGRHEVRVDLSGYGSSSRTVNLSPGSSETLSFQLQPIRRTGTVSFTSSPSGADVYVDGSYVGTTPTGPVVLDEGGYQARFSLPGYLDATVDFTVNANASRSVSADLRAATGTLVVQANVGGAQVFLNGRASGEIPSGSGRLVLDDLSPGSYQVTLVAPGFSTFVGEVSVQGGRTAELQARQSRR